MRQCLVHLTSRTFNTSGEVKTLAILPPYEFSILLKGSVNYFHSLRVAIAINLVRYPSGALAYFISAPARKPETLRGVAAQFNRWDIYGARESVDFAHLWPAGAGDGEGAVITFTPDQFFWDRLNYTQVQQPNFFKVLADAKLPLWIQVMLAPAKPEQVRSPLAKLYKGDFRKYGRKEKDNKLQGAARNEYTVLATRHQDLMKATREENLFFVTYRVATWAITSTGTSTGTGDQTPNRVLKTSKGEFRDTVKDLANILFIGMPGQVKINRVRAGKIWVQFNAKQRPVASIKQVMLGQSEIAWVFPWPAHNYFGWEFLGEKVTDITGHGRQFLVNNSQEQKGIFLGRQATQASESTITDMALVRPLETSLGVWGFPGTGKTNAVNTILQQLLARGENVLYLNGVKDEDHLSGLAPDRARIWRPETLGFDPFEHVPGIPPMRMIADFVEGYSYTKNLLVALENLMRVGLMKYAIYQGWGETFEGLNEDRGPGKKFDLKKLPVVVTEELKRSKYAGEVRANLEGATETRVRGFLYSPLGRVFASNVPVPIREMAAGFNLVLLNKLQVDDQCFVAWVLLKKIYQFLTSQKERGHRQALTIVLEEAHVFLTKTETNEESEFGKARAMLAEFLAMLIKEGREYGVRLIIVDQEPSDLIRSAIQPLSETLTFRVGALDAAVFHQDPGLVAAIGALPNYFAIYKGKEVTHEVLLRPPRFQESPQDQHKAAIQQAKRNVRELILQNRSSELQQAQKARPNVSRSNMTPEAQDLTNEDNEELLIDEDSSRSPIHLLEKGGEKTVQNKVTVSPSIDPATKVYSPEKSRDVPGESLKDNPREELEENPRDLQDKVFEYLVSSNRKQGVPVEEIEEACKIKRTLLDTLLHLLEREGAIVQVRSAHYAIV